MGMEKIGKWIMIWCVAVWIVFMIIGIATWGVPVGLDIILPMVVTVILGVVFLVGLVIWIIGKIKGKKK